MAGLYVHVPFRRESRPYDESYSVPPTEEALSHFETALCRELTHYTHDYADDEPLTTLYAGGGRPSLLPRTAVQSILTTFVEAFDTSAFEEATAEVNPADARPQTLHTLRRMGFDRLSLAVLSFFPSVLASVDAPHTAAESMRALRATREAGFETFSVDLLFGLPGQPLNTWEATLWQAIELDVPHITITEVTGTDTAASPDRAADHLELAMTLLSSEGYAPYELTHFARPDHRSIHQENYYAHGNYLGVGPSSQSFWWPNRPSPAQARRWANVRDLEQYDELLNERYPPTAYRETLDRATLAQEYVLLRLRTHDGLDLRRLDTHYGVDLQSEKENVLARLRSENLIHDENDRVRLTVSGRLKADAITKKLLPTS